MRIPHRAPDSEPLPEPRTGDRPQPQAAAPRTQPKGPRGGDRIDRARRLLLAVGLLCLGYWGWAQADAWRYQAEQNRHFDRLLAAGVATGSAAPSATDEIQEPGGQNLGAENPGTHDPILQNRAARSGDAPASASADSPGARDPATGSATRASGIGGAAPEGGPRPAAGPRAVARLRIPRIGLSTIVADGADPVTLRRSAGRVPGTARPGEGGNLAVAGHRDTVFRELQYAAPGDDVLLETAQGTARYRVETVDVVAPDAVDVLAPTAESTLTLITCYPFSMLGPAPDRYVVRARRIGGTL